MNVAGELWWTTAQAVAQLRVTRNLINQWVARSKRAGHQPGADPDTCPRCRTHPSWFPHVDPPVRRGREAGYRAQQLLDAEAYTAGSPRGGNRRPT